MIGTRSSITTDFKFRIQLTSHIHRALSQRGCLAEDTHETTFVTLISFDNKELMDDSWDMSGPRINVGCKGVGVMLMSYYGGTDGGIGNACGGGGGDDDGKIDEFVHGNWRLMWL
ncbi:hypothetical protein LWI28_019587 [Acer negundo]|uniref:Uncharacterized protein n=1 Tax=Acer negundo TaxID=4023 RepID=A0AAD5IBA5_ACENE|nr:hypothetical protein LWI28_019587 [Acer negundo]